MTQIVMKAEELTTLSLDEDGGLLIIQDAQLGDEEDCVLLSERQSLVLRDFLNKHFPVKQEG